MRSVIGCAFLSDCSSQTHKDIGSTKTLWNRKRFSLLAEFRFLLLVPRMVQIVHRISVIIVSIIRHFISHIFRLTDLLQYNVIINNFDGINCAYLQSKLLAFLFLYSYLQPGFRVKKKKRLYYQEVTTSHLLSDRLQYAPEGSSVY